jgi:exopolysaccharide biosynthesis protein
VPPSSSRYELLRLRTREGEETTVYLVRHPIASTRAAVVAFGGPVRLDAWCREHRRDEAIVAGFFVRDPERPLGEVVTGGTAIEHEPIAAQWRDARACVSVADGRVQLAPRAALADDRATELVCAGPLLVRDGVVIEGDDDPEGFSAGSAQFDSDITAERHPRCALGVTEDEILAVCCDGRRTGVDAGLLLDELARLMVSFGAREAINLDGGGSATLVHRGHLLNRPYSSVDQPAPASRPIVTALVFDPQPS